MDPLRYILVLAVTVAHILTVSQEEETIEWIPDAKLTWKDFKGKTPRNARASATTASGISYQFSTSLTEDTLELDYKVSTFFYPQKSWYQPKLCNELILSHEQLHFDISELYARKMRKKLASTNFTRNVKAEVNSIYKEILKELGDFQDLYDKQTNFSRNEHQQLLWDKKIREALNN